MTCQQCQSLKSQLEAADRLIESQLAVVSHYQRRHYDDQTRYRAMLNHVADLEDAIEAINEKAAA